MIASIRNSALVALLVWTGCSSDTERAAHPSVNTGGASSGGRQSMGGSASHGGDAASAGENAAGHGGSTDEAGGAGSASGGASGDGSGGEGSGGDPNDAPVATCAELKGVGIGQRLVVSTSFEDQLGGITPDERVIAWTTDDGNGIQLLTAERADAQQPFSTPRKLSIAAALDRVTLSPDGLRVIYAAANRRSFVTLSREATTEPFAASNSFEFSLLNDPDALPQDESYGDPVLSANDLAFVYSRYGVSRTQTLFISHRFSKQAPWQVGHEISIDAQFAATPTDRFRPTSLTADELTLFLWHPADTTAYAVHFDSSQFTFQSYAELGALGGAAPNADCTRVYYDSGDLFVAERR
ncbi:MAG: hypothetical protein QM756_14260 [Polyangiaceae bacterium]